MAFTVDDNGNITLIQGDSGEYTITGIEVEDESDYATYFAIQDENRKPVGDEVQSIISGGMSSFAISSLLTDKLTVPTNDDSATYYFGIKLVNTETDEEDTLMIAGGTYGTLNTITVYPRKVVGA